MSANGNAQGIAVAGDCACQQPSDLAPAHAPRLYFQPLEQRFLSDTPLSNAQEQRLATLTSPARRLEYRLSRQCLQRALAHESPASDSQQLPASGPPVLPAESGLHAALAHTSGLAVCALYQRPVGLDLEQRGRTLHWQSLAKRWFTPLEQASLAAMSPAAGQDRFLLLWTLKEAWLKATHQGIANNLQQLQLTHAGTDPAHWQLSLPAGETGWQAGAMAVSGYWLSLLWQTEEAVSGPCLLTAARQTDSQWQLLTRPCCRTP